MFERLNKIPPLVRVPLRYGLMGGVLGFVLVVILFYIHRHPFLVPVFFDFRVALFGVFIFFILRELRDYYFNNLLFFWQGMSASFIFVVTFALIASSMIWVFGELSPRFVTEYIDLFMAQVRSFPKETIDQIGKEVYEANLAKLPSTTAFDLATLYFWQCFVIGLFISIILSVILRRQPAHTSL